MLKSKNLISNISFNDYYGVSSLRLAQKHKNSLTMENKKIKLVNNGDNKKSEDAEKV